MAENKSGPQKTWLHHIGKANDPICPCGHPREDDDHITFSCPRFQKERKELIGPTATWEELGTPRWVKEGDDDPYDQVEAFFGFLFAQLT